MKYDLNFYRTCFRLVKSSFLQMLKITLYETALFFKRVDTKGEFHFYHFLADYMNDIPTCCPRGLSYGKKD